MEFNPDLTYEFPSQLFREHSADTPSGFAQEAYDRTECGVRTTFLFANGDGIMASDLTPQQDTMEYAQRHFVGVKHHCIVEGGNGEWEADALLFPFSDEDLADAWQYLEDEVNQYLEQQAAEEDDQAAQEAGEEGGES